MSATLMTVATKSLSGPDSTPRQILDKIPHAFTNISSPERVISALAGGYLMLFGCSSKGPGPISMLTGAYLLYRGATGNCVVSQQLGISTADATAPESTIAAGQGTRVEASVRIARPAPEVYRFWREFENLPKFMSHLVEVKKLPGNRTRWKAQGPLGLKVEWDAEIVADRANEMISWKSCVDADVDTAGSVRFKNSPDGRATEVRVNLRYDPPAGKLGTAIAKLFGQDPQRQIEEDLLGLKRHLENGR